MIERPENAEESILVDPHEKKTDVFENTLRPKTLLEYVGQDQLKRNLHIFLSAARDRGEPLEHILLYGPPGLGKTTLSHIIATEMGANIRMTSGPAIEKAGDLASILTNLKEGDVLFIDEIHRLRTPIEEILYSAMEDFCMDIMIGKGPSARSMRLSIPKFTLIGATTKMNMLSSPLRDRFGHVYKLEFYTDEDMTSIVSRSASILGIDIGPSASLEIAQRSRKTPRISNRLLRRVRDFVQMAGKKVIGKEDAHHALTALGIDQLGLDDADRNLLCAMIDTFGGRPVGLGTIAAATAEEEGTIEDVYEPFLLQLGFIERTPRGRRPTEKAYEHLKKVMPESSLQARLL